MTEVPVKKRTSKARGILLTAFLLFAVFVGALVLRKYETATRKVETPAKTEPAASAIVTLFFASADGQGLVREGREVEVEDAVEDRVESVVDELIRGPLGSHGATLPPNVRILGVKLKGNVAQIDFGHELKEAAPAGSAGEMTAVYSIVDTVTVNFPEIKAVQLLVEGAPVDSLGGHLDLKDPLPPDYSLEKAVEAKKADDKAVETLKR
jgi:spore germination protein GerM